MLQVSEGDVRTQIATRHATEHITATTLATRKYKQWATARLLTTPCAIVWQQHEEPKHKNMMDKTKKQHAPQSTRRLYNSTTRTTE